MDRHLIYVSTKLFREGEEFYEKEVRIEYKKKNNDGTLSETTFIEVKFGGEWCILELKKVGKKNTNSETPVATLSRT